MPEQLANWDYQWSQVVGLAWADDAFKQRLFANPAKVLKEWGVTVPAGLQVKVLENTDPLPEDTDELLHLVLHPRPSAEALSEEELFGGVPGHAVAGCGCERCSCHHCYWCERCSCERCRCDKP
jgi:hypothetical protein